MAYPVVPRGERAIVTFFYEAPHRFSRWCFSQMFFQSKTTIIVTLALSVFALLCVRVIVSSLCGRVTPPSPPKTPPSSEPAPASGEDLFSFLEVLNASLDELFNDIKAQIRDALITKIEESPWTDHPKVIPIKKTLEYLKANDIDERKRGVLGQEWQYRFNDELKTIPVSSDGNCLYHATCALLKLVDKEELTPEALRDRVANWIDAKYKEAEEQAVQEQDPDCEHPGILDHLRASIESCQAVRMRDLNSELESLEVQEAMGGDVLAIAAARAKINEELPSVNDLTRKDYIALCRQDKFHGGSVEIYAISQIFEVNIEIERLYVTYADGQIVSSRRIQGFDRSYGVGFDRTITLVNVGGGHYDAALPES